ncbi:MAG: class I SAM-dependent methyltransferase [Actinomycetota bacterium]
MTESNFDRIAEHYDESLPAHVVDHYLEKRTAFVLEHCPLGSALDVGCGTGALAARLADAGYEVTGLDPSEGMLRVLQERRSRVRAVRGSGTSIPFEDGRFDLVLSVATMHHIAAPDDVRRTLAEMVRVTSPGGRVLVWDHNPRNPYWRLLMARVPQDTGEERLVGVRELVRGLSEAGAEPVLVTQLGMVPDFIPRALLGAAATAERAVERTPLLRRVCAHNVVLAAKR